MILQALHCTALTAAVTLTLKILLQDPFKSISTNGILKKYWMDGRQKLGHQFLPQKFRKSFLHFPESLF